MKKLIVAYRNNDLFEKYVPAILSYVPTDLVLGLKLLTQRVC